MKENVSDRGSIPYFHLNELFKVKAMMKSRLYGRIRG